MDSLTPENKKTEQNYNLSTHIVSIAVFVSIIVGLAAGVVGAIYVTPWYQQNFIEGSEDENVKNRKVVLDEESAVIETVKKVNPAVVSIVVSKDLPTFDQFASPFGDYFFSTPTGETQRQRVGAGSGFVVTSDGMIVTNKHVVNDTEAEYTVITSDGTRLDATVLATDPFNDLAVVKVNAQNLPTVDLGDSDSLVLGQSVIAIGNALGEFENTVTTGVVSGIGRNVTASNGLALTENLSEVIQTDAAINPGNSGGPLLDLAGRVIGVNTAVSFQAQLVGFAIPVNQVKKVVSDVQQTGKVLRPFLGIRYTLITSGFAEVQELETDHGILIVSGNTRNEPAVIPDSPADEAGLKAGDIVLSVEGDDITIDNQLTDILRDYEPGDQVTLEVLKGGTEQITLEVVLGEAQ